MRPFLLSQITLFGTGSTVHVTESTGKSGFVNSTVIFQINDCRQIPIIIPNEEQLEAFNQLFYKALEIKMTSNDTNQLKSVQKQLDELTLQLYGIA